jgi:hypothetical protein
MPHRGTTTLPRFWWLLRLPHCYLHHRNSLMSLDVSGSRFGGKHNLTRKALIFHIPSIFSGELLLCGVGRGLFMFLSSHKGLSVKLHLVREPTPPPPKPLSLPPIFLRKCNGITRHLITFLLGIVWTDALTSLISQPTPFPPSPSPHRGATASQLAVAAVSLPPALPSRNPLFLRILFFL